MRAPALAAFAFVALAGCAPQAAPLDGCAVSGPDTGVLLPCACNGGRWYHCPIGVGTIVACDQAATVEAWSPRCTEGRCPTGIPCALSTNCCLPTGGRATCEEAVLVLYSRPDAGPACNAGWWDAGGADAGSIDAASVDAGPVLDQCLAWCARLERLGCFAVDPFVMTCAERCSASSLGSPSCDAAFAALFSCDAAQPDASVCNATGLGGACLAEANAALACRTAIDVRR